MEKQNIKRLYRCIEKEQYEIFKNIVQEVRDGKVFELSDIDKLCDIFCIEWKYIEPFQYRDVQRMIILSIKKSNDKKGIEILAIKLNEIAEKKPMHIKSFLNFLINSFSNEELMILAINLKKQKLKTMFVNNLLMLRNYDDEERMKKVEEMLKILQEKE